MSVPGARTRTRGSGGPILTSPHVVTISRGGASEHSFSSAATGRRCRSGRRVVLCRFNVRYRRRSKEITPLSDQLALVGLIVPALLLVLVLIWILLLISGRRRGSVKIRGLGLQVSVDTSDERDADPASEHGPLK